MNYTNSTNFVAFPEFKVYRHGYIFQIWGCLTTILIAMVAFFGNLAVIVVSFREEKLRTQIGNFLIVFLSSVDVVTSIFVMIPSAIAMAADAWPFGVFICKVNATFNYGLSCASSHTAAMISLDRALAIVYPLKYQTIMTSKVMIGIFTWVLSNTAFCMVLALSLLYTITYDYNEAICAGAFSEYKTKLFFYVASSSCFVLPATIIVICNTIILRQIRKSSSVTPRQIISKGTNDFDYNMRRRKDVEMRKSVYSMMVVIIVYFIYFAPYTFTKQGKSISDIDAPPWLNYVSTLMMFISSATNPFIYGILRKDYRDGFKKIYRLLKEKLHF
ncbi:octopamine receptor beta-1R-like [Parasteatoda tepidariorum]|uniref:octopamine receptor beta-1R-like n=1 Tax=Parasteatoda tepidariorum TaxID=114398 RepID=UPI001C71DE23|nr:octopamine receptor beta-1R-like [Parasteatoda tepidariorum]